MITTSASDLRAEFDVLERTMRELLAAVDSPSANFDSITRAMRRCEEHTPAPQTILAIRASCTPEERVELEARLRRLVDLNAILSQTTERATALTALALEKTRNVQRNLAALGPGASDAPRLDFSS